MILFIAVENFLRWLATKLAPPMMVMGSANWFTLKLTTTDGLILPASLSASKLLCWLVNGGENSAFHAPPIDNGGISFIYLLTEWSGM